MIIRPNNRLHFRHMLPVFLSLTLALASCTFPPGQQQQTIPNPPIQGSQHSPAENGIPVYFSKSRGSQTVTEAVVRQMPADPTGGREIKPLEYAVYQLLKGPSDEESAQGYFSEIPKGTRLLGVSYGPRQVRINLSQQFTSGGGSNSMQQRLAELTRTVRSVEKEHPVYLDIEGQELHVLGGEGLMVQEPINTGKQDVQ